MNLGTVPYMNATGKGSEADLATGTKQADFCYSYETAPLAKLIGNAQRDHEKDSLVGVKDFTIFVETRGLQDCWVLHGLAVNKDGKVQGNKQ